MPNSCQNEPVLPQKYPFLVQNYTIHIQKNQFLPKSTAFWQNYLIPAKKNPVLAKILQYLPYKKTNLAKKYPFYQSS